MTHVALAQPMRVGAALDLQRYGDATLDVVRSAGFQPSIAFFPSERSFLMLRQGEIDAEFARIASSVEDFKSAVRLIGPIACSEVVAFVDVRRSFSISNASSLRGKKVGVIQGAKLATTFLRSEGIDFTTTVKRDGAYKMLELGRVDVVVDTWPSGLAEIKALQAENNIQVSGPVLSTHPAYLILRHRLAEWGPRLQSAFEADVAAGRWSARIGTANESIGLPRGLGLSCLKHEALPTR